MKGFQISWTAKYREIQELLNASTLTIYIHGFYTGKINGHLTDK